MHAFEAKSYLFLHGLKCWQRFDNARPIKKQRRSLCAGLILEIYIGIKEYSQIMENIAMEYGLSLFQHCVEH